MADVVDIGMEADLSEWDSTVDADGDMSQHADAALGGSAGGMKLVVDDANEMYGVIALDAAAASQYRYRFYIDPNGLTMADGDEFRVFAHDDAATLHRTRVLLHYAAATGYGIELEIRDDNNANQSVAHETGVSDAPHWVEILVEKASGAAANDGTAEMWIDDVSIASVSNLDFFTLFAAQDAVHLGAFTNIDAGTSGTFYLDELLVNNDGGYIGPAGSGRVKMRLIQQGVRQGMHAGM